MIRTKQLIIAQVSFYQLDYFCNLIVGAVNWVDVVPCIKQLGGWVGGSRGNALLGPKKYYSVYGLLLQTVFTVTEVIDSNVTRFEGSYFD